MIIDRVRAGYPKQGLIWHFQGSGKSYLMEFAAVKMRMLPDLKNPTVIIVDDRLDLESQITAQFHSSDVGNLASATTREQLMTMLRQDIRKIIITTIFRFQEVFHLLTCYYNFYILYKLLFLHQCQNQLFLYLLLIDKKILIIPYLINFQIYLYLLLQLYMVVLILI